MTDLPEPLRAWFDACPFAVTAFSGGVDSSLVAWLATHLLGPERSLAVISASPSLKLSELDAAKAFAHRHAIPLQVVVTRELLDPDYFSNPANRCFFCKRTLYTELEDIARERPDAWILNGTNLDDLDDHRPGLEAARAFRVRSPLAESGLDKQAVRKLAADLGLECWNKPASPCLSSRIPYGERVTLEKLRRIEAAEAWLTAQGFPVCRVRHPGNNARVEVPCDRLAALQLLAPALSSALLPLGFQAVEIDPEGFISGKLNRDLP